MRLAIQYVRSVVFIFTMYAAMVILAIFFTPFALIWRSWAFHAVHTYCAFVIWAARWMVGLRSEIRGEVPTGEVIVAAKHQSFFDIILIVRALPRPRFVMKRQLKWAPILGWYGYRIGCIPVDRGRKRAAIQQMVDGVRAATWPGQLVIYPQGTRVAADAYIPYKVGPSILYEQLDQPCVPVATNVGVFWPRQAILRKPGLAIVEFLPPVERGLSGSAFMKTLEETVEGNSDRLMAEVGYDAPAARKARTKAGVH